MFSISTKFVNSGGVGSTTDIIKRILSLIGLLAAPFHISLLADSQIQAAGTALPAVVLCTRSFPQEVNTSRGTYRYRRTNLYLQENTYSHREQNTTDIIVRG